MSRQPFNKTGSYFGNMLAGRRDSAPGTDSNNPELFREHLEDMILCACTTVGSTMGGMVLTDRKQVGVGPGPAVLAAHRSWVRW